MRKYILRVSLVANLALLALAHEKLTDLAFEAIYYQRYKAQRESLRQFERENQIKYPDLSANNFFWFDQLSLDVRNGARLTPKFCQALIEIGEAIDRENTKRGVSNVSDQ